MKTIGVLGTGTMGAGIIQVMAQTGYNVVLRARRQTSVDKGIAKVTKNLEKLVAKEKMTEDQKNEILSRVKGSTDISIIKDAYVTHHLFSSISSISIDITNCRYSRFWNISPII